MGIIKNANEKLNEEMILNYYSFGQCRGAWKEFTLSDKYPEESLKIQQEFLKCAQNNIKIFGYFIY